MTIVVADTGPPHYLVLIDRIDLLPRLFGRVVLPAAVREELDTPKAPAKIRLWLAASPPWLDAGPAPDIELRSPSKLDRGEYAAIAIAKQLGASLLLMDDRAGVDEARRQHLRVTGTLGILLLAARRGLTDFDAALSQLKTTNFRYSPALLEAMQIAWNKERSA